MTNPNYFYVYKLLGEGTYNDLVDYAMEGRMKKMADFVQHLGQCDNGGPNRLYGNHNDRGAQTSEVAMKAILSDWWDNGLNLMTQKQAIQKLVLVLEHRDVHVMPLAHKLRARLNAAPAAANTGHAPTPAARPLDARTNKEKMEAMADILINELVKPKHGQGRSVQNAV
jgi:hypothetical protein